MFVTYKRKPHLKKLETFVSERLFSELKQLMEYKIITKVW